MAIDAYLKDPDAYAFDERLMNELESVSHREYCTGYYRDEPIDASQLASTTGYIREKAYFATAISNDEIRPIDPELRVSENGELYPFIQRNKISIGDRAEIISPNKIGRGFTVTELYGEDGTPIESAPHPAQKFFVRVPFEVKEGDIIRSGE
jgi:putative protease